MDNELHGFRLYYEISDDGQSYILYTNHFCLKGVKKLKYLYTDGQLTQNKTGETVDLDNGIFKEFGERLKRGQTRMQAYVLPDRQLMWDMYVMKTMENVTNISTLIHELSEWDATDFQKKTAGEWDSASAFIAAAGGADNLNTLFGNIGYQSSLVGTTLTATDLALVMLRIQAEALDQNQSYWEALSTALNKNKTALIDSVSSAALSLSASALYGNWVGALVGLCIWGTCQFSAQASETDTWYATKTPDWTDLYKNFYYTSNKIDCGSAQAKAALSSGRCTYGVLQQPASMTDEKWKILSQTINKYPLTIIYNPKKDTYQFRNFSKAFTTLIRLYGEDPYSLEQVLEEFYRSYARAFWNLPKNILFRFAKEECESIGNPDHFEEEFAAAGDILLPLDSEIDEWVEDFVSVTRTATRSQLTSAMETAMRKTFREVEQNMDRLTSLLNTTLVFHVTDNSLLNGQSFRNSIYCVDWMSIPENNLYLPKNNPDGGYDDPEFITPMRFVCEEPLFRPLDSLRDAIPYTEYYPFQPDFIPRAKKNQNTDVVYSCTLYHYLMMGAPRQMLFKDVSNPKTYVSQPGIYGDLLFPQFNENTSVADVYVSVEGKK